MSNTFTLSLDETHQLLTSVMVCAQLSFKNVIKVSSFIIPEKELGKTKLVGSEHIKNRTFGGARFFFVFFYKKQVLNELRENVGKF